jgi:SEC-C motif-containing protein
MRSRYSAYVRRDESYLLRTWHPATKPAALDVDGGHWLGLEILATTKGQAADASGTVTFAAHYVGDAGDSGTMREHSRFERLGDAWLYVDGDVADEGIA